VAPEGKRNVLHVIAAYALGGAEKHLLDVLDGLNRTRFDVFVALPEGDLARNLDTRGVRNERVPLRGVWDLWALVRLFRCMRQEKPDVVHTHDPRASVFGRMAARWAGVPMILSTVHTSPVCREHIGELRNRMYMWADQRTARWNRYIVAVSEAVRRELIQGVGVDAEKVLTLHPGIRLDAFRRTYDGGSLAPRASLNMGIVGRLEPEKGHELVLSAMPEILRRSSAPVTLYILGEGSRRQALLDMVNAWDLSSHVVFLGYVKDVRSSLEQLDLVVSASTREGWGIALIEAMAMGLPVVAPRTGGIPEMIEDGVTGILFSPGDAHALAGAVVDLLKDRTRVRRMGAAARCAVKKRFDVDGTVKALEAIYAGENVQ
jgi:glycosyltransferase involved in cell wall biosynthesis